MLSFPLVKALHIAVTVTDDFSSVVQAKMKQNQINFSWEPKDIIFRNNFFSNNLYKFKELQ